VADWKDLAVVLCVALVVLGAGALAIAAQMSTIVKGRVVEKGTASFDLDSGEQYSTKTISVLIENDDRVFRIESGTVVEYAVSDDDALLVQVGSEVELFVSSHSRVARVIDLAGASPV
jgi:hypothetical protein